MGFNRDSWEEKNFWFWPHENHSILQQHGGQDRVFTTEVGSVLGIRSSGNTRPIYGILHKMFTYEQQMRFYTRSLKINESK